MMCAWKAQEHIDLDFADFQLDERINSRIPAYIKSVSRDKIRRADTFILLIGTDTSQKTTFVKDEVEVAIEKGCRLIGVNINNSRFKDDWCPHWFASKGALLVPFSPRIVAKALGPWTRPAGGVQDWYFPDTTYTSLGYVLNGNAATLPPKPNPFASGRPPWARNAPPARTCRLAVESRDVHRRRRVCLRSTTRCADLRRSRHNPPFA
jgi:hypothetical protein